MRWGFAASAGLAWLTLLAGAVPAQAATAELGAVGFVNDAQDPDGNPQYLVGVQAAESSPMPVGFRPYVIPSGYGVVTQWSHSTGTVGGPLGFAVMRALPGNEYVNVGSEVRTVQAFTVHRFATRIPVRPGDRFLLASENQGGQPPLQLYTTTTSLGNRVAELTDYAPGDPQPVVQTRDGHLLDVAARVETDADGDGYGDDTQDACPSRADTQGPCGDQGGSGGPGAPDKTKPKIGGLKLSSTAFRAAGSGGAFTAAVPVGTKVSFNASEASAVTFKVQRKASGRRVGKKCKKPSRRNRTKKRCTRYVAVKGSFVFNAVAGTNRFTFRGRIRARKLRPGAYRLGGKARDAAKNTSTVAPKAFRIVR